LEAERQQTNLLKLYHELCALNTAESNDQAFLLFVEQINTIATEIKKKPKLEQLVTMYLLLNSQHHKTLIQLATGFGKSFMLGLMARYLNLIHGKKIAVVVPNEVLAAIQQQKYSPWSSKDIAELFLGIASINYCTYEDLLVGVVPVSTILLVDEIDSLFFTDVPVVTGNRFTSAILLLNKYRVIGMTATFRGERGLNVMKTFLKDSTMIRVGEVEHERKL